MAELYEVGLRIAVSGNAAEALASISSRLLGLHTNAKEVEKSLGNWRGLILSAGAALAGIEVFKFGAEAIKAGATLEHFEAQAKAAGYTGAQQADIMAAAWKNAGANINASVSESYKNILELAQVTGNVGEAVRILPAFTKADNALASLKDDDLRGKVHGSSKQTYDTARTLELLGVTQDEKKLDSYLATITKEIIGMRGLTDGSKLFMGVQAAGSARYGWNEEFVGKVLGPLLQESARNGVGLYQLDRSFGAGVMTQMMAQGAEKYGLFSEKDEFYDTRGRFKGMKTGSIAGWDLMRANPEQWATSVVLPLLTAHGVDINDTNAMAKAITEMSRGNKNLGVILDALLLPANRKQLAKEAGNIERVPDDAATILQKNDPALAMAAFETQWNNLLTALGKPLVAQATAALETLTRGIEGLAAVAGNNPELTRFADIAVAVAAGLATAVGAIKATQFALNIGKGAAALAAGKGAGEIAAGAEAAASSTGYLAGLGPVAAVAAAATTLAIAAQPAVKRALEAGNPAYGVAGGDLPYMPSPLSTPHATGAPSYLDPGIYERSWRAQQARVADPEAARGRALMALSPAPNVTINPQPVNVKVDVTLASDLILSKIESALSAAFTLPHSSAGTDGRANHMPPDSYNF